MANAIVLGAGMVGSVMAADLATDRGMAVSIADVSERNLAAAVERAARAGTTVRAVRADLSKPEAIRELVLPFDVVLGSLPSVLGLSALRAVIEAGKSYCDISFMPEDALDLDALAKERGVTCVVDCGVAPGMSNMIAGFEAARMERCERIGIYVGGLPRERRWPFEYKAAFAPSDVIEEYTRPSRVVRHGALVVLDALSEPELMDFAGVGTLEAVITDGLRSLARTMPNVPNMEEKTLRYPGHYELMRVFRATGLFSKEPIDARGVTVRPLDVVSALMFPKWTYEPGEEDLTAMRVVVEGQRDGKRVRVVRDLFDVFDRQSGATSMARTTGLPCTAVARMLLSGRVRGPGVLAPEHLGQRAGILDAVLAELADKGVRYTTSVVSL